MIQCFSLYEAGRQIESMLCKSKTEKAPGVNLFTRHMIIVYNAWCREVGNRLIGWHEARRRIKLKNVVYMYVYILFDDRRNTETNYCEKVQREQ